MWPDSQIPRIMVHLCMRDCHVNEYVIWFIRQRHEYVTRCFATDVNMWHVSQILCMRDCHVMCTWRCDMRHEYVTWCFFATDVNMWHDSLIPRIMLHLGMRDCHVNEYVTWLICHRHERVTWLLCHRCEYVKWMPHTTDYGTPAYLCGRWVNYIRLPNPTDYTDSSNAHIWGGLG